MTRNFYEETMTDDCHNFENSTVRQFFEIIFLFYFRYFATHWYRQETITKFVIFYLFSFFVIVVYFPNDDG